MKKLLSIFVLFLAIAATVSAQVDISRFSNVGPGEISELLGNPQEEWRDDIYPGCLILGDEEYIAKECSFQARIVLKDSDYSLLGFNTYSSDYCVLSDYISGGVKVGDTITGLQAYDFAHTTYGRGKEGNAFLKIRDFADGSKEYCVFREEFQSIFFYVKNGAIISIAFKTAEDDPYPDYDYTNRLL